MQLQFFQEGMFFVFDGFGLRSYLSLFSLRLVQLGGIGRDLLKGRSWQVIA